jgi:hypothetical protein
MATRPGNAIIAGVVISVLILLVWVVQLATLADLGRSDAAGNALGEAFAAIEIIVLWTLLGILLIVCGVSGRMPWPAALAAVVLLPASGFAAVIALNLLADHQAPPFLWPIITPALVPPIVVGFGFWTLLPAMRATIPAGVASGIAWGATLILCIAIWPMVQVREHVLEHEADLRAKWAEDFAKLAPDAPLWQWTPFLDTRDEARQEAVLQGIRKLERRQPETEIMLDRGETSRCFISEGSISNRHPASARRPVPCCSGASSRWYPTPLVPGRTLTLPKRWPLPSPR